MFQWPPVCFSTKCAANASADGAIVDGLTFRSILRVDTNASIVYSEVTFGGVAQLVERLNGIQEARGSIPLTSRKNRIH